MTNSMASPGRKNPVSLEVFAEILGEVSSSLTSVMGGVPSGERCTSMLSASEVEDVRRMSVGAPGGTVCVCVCVTSNSLHTCIAKVNGLSQTHI